MNPALRPGAARGWPRRVSSPLRLPLALGQGVGRESLGRLARGLAATRLLGQVALDGILEHPNTQIEVAVASQKKQDAREIVEVEVPPSDVLPTCRGRTRRQRKDLLVGEKKPLDAAHLTPLGRKC